MSGNIVILSPDPSATFALGERGPAGDLGWSPVLAVVNDSARRVLQVQDWVGGSGAKPAVGKYIGASGLVTLIADGIDVRGPIGLTGNTGATGETGAQGDKGWSPVLAVVTDGTRRVLQVTDWVGGAGTKPATGDYVGPTGLVSAIASAVDVRGATGATGATGDTGATGPVGPAPQWKGAYAGGTTYSYGDLVFDQNSSWVYINATPASGNAPPTLPTTSNARWQLVCSVGVHTHAIADVVNLQTSLDAKAPLDSPPFTTKTDLGGTAPQETVTETDGATNGKKWRWVYNGGVAKWQLVNDADNSSQDILAVTRSGLTLSSIDFKATISVNGVAVSLNGHTHTIANITSLQTTLDAKQPLMSFGGSGVGGFQSVNVDNNQYALPSGGTWAYDLYVLGSSGLITTVAGANSGGSLVVTGTPGTLNIRGWVWRYA